MTQIRILEPEDPDKRPTGLLTNIHREYLTGKKGELTSQHENQLRLRIRKRIQHGIRDFRQIRRLSDKDRGLIFNDITTTSPLTEGIVHMLAFVYGGIIQYTNLDFSTLLEAAIQTAENERLRDSDYSLAEVEVTIDSSYHKTVTIDDLRKRLDQGEKLTDSEIGRLARAGKLTSDDFSQLKRKSDSAEIEPPEEFQGTKLLTIADYSDADTE